MWVTETDDEANINLVSKLSYCTIIIAAAQLLIRGWE